MLHTVVAAAALTLTGPQVGAPAPDFTLTTVSGKRAMRVCITNHRTKDEDLGLVLDALARIVREARATLT